MGLLPLIIYNIWGLSYGLTYVKDKLLDTGIIKDINEIGEFVCLQMEKKKLLNT